MNRREHKEHKRAPDGHLGKWVPFAEEAYVRFGAWGSSAFAAFLVVKDLLSR